MFHDGKGKINPFQGHCGFSVVPSITKTLWIIDFCVSSHVYCDIEIMVSTYHFEKPLMVHLPDG